MNLGIFTDGLETLSFTAMLDRVSALGLQAVEIGTGCFSPRPHCDLDLLLDDAAARAAFTAEIRQRGLEISALNCSGNPLHPRPERGAADDAVLRKTIMLAEALGVPCVVAMSGCPGAPGESRFPNWVTFLWPDDFLELRTWQWEEKILPYWRDVAAFARAHGGVRLCLEMHPGMAVYNTETLLRLRHATDDLIGANLDPSHLFWQGMDPLVVIRALGPAVFHVHAKDTRVDVPNTSLVGALDTSWPARPRDMPWVFRAVGYGHGAEFWADFVSELRVAGYDGTLSIEHEDPLLGADDAIAKAVALLHTVVPRA
ncbi:MAG: sugar phosphate isomerase/epimerase [Chloroflexota bacterium]